jgi:hypothetical protein
LLVRQEELGGEGYKSVCSIARVDTLCSVEFKKVNRSQSRANRPEQLGMRVQGQNFRENSGRFCLECEMRPL